MSLFPPPQDIEAEVFASLPLDLRITDRTSAWVEANKPGLGADSFLEGPSFDAAGNLYLVDIPYGRILRLAPDRTWSLVVEYDGWPNGLKFHRDGRAFIADYRRGILALDLTSGALEEVFASRASEGFKGCNDLFFADDGLLYFTDQGQTGMHDPTGRVYRADLESRRLTQLIGTGPSPNGLVMNLKQNLLYVAMTRGNAIWRLVLLPDGSVSKVGIFVQLSGGLSGPDGMALDSQGNIFVAQAGMGCVWAFSPLGEPLWRIRCEAIGLTTTNLAFGGPDGRDLYITVSDAGVVARARLPHPGQALFGKP
ncbi:MAG: SMP-30/gluconolactonase/LRE family protein [Rhodospirillales bacterium]